MADAMSDILGTLTTNTASGMSPAIMMAIFIFVAFVVGGIAVVVWWFKKDAKTWNLKFRVYPENPDIDGCSIPSGFIKGKRVRLKDGKVVFRYKSPIQGYTISPELTIYTRPREYDVVVTSDKRLFLITSVSSIDVKRKAMNVNIMHPDIEMDRQELQQQNDRLFKDNNMDKWKMLGKIAVGFMIIMFIIIGGTVGGNYYIQNKEIQLEIKQKDLEIQANQQEVLSTMTEVANAMRLLMPELKELKGTNNLRGSLE